MKYEWKRRYIVGITGASGVVIGCRLVEQLLKRECRVDLVITEAGCRVLKGEMGISGIEPEKGLKLYDIHDIGAPIGSGSVKTDGMIIAPCSMGTLGCIANGISANLLQRAADVVLKERRKLIIVPRETPLNTIHISNLLTLSNCGAVILPPVPAYYIRPKSIEDMINFIIGKILDQLDIEHKLYTAYGN